MNIELEGFHGTNYALVDKILDEGLNPSLGDKQWLGDGCYFFIKGLSKNPAKQAEKWAQVQAWDNASKSMKYEKTAVLRANLSADEEKFLDLTTADGLEVLEYVQEKCISKLSQIGKRLKYVDGFLINYIRKENLFEIDIAKGNFYIKLTKEARISRINKRTANCTICSVYNPQKNIVNIEKFMMEE